MRTHTARRPATTQWGRSLVEMMLSIAIGLAVTAGVSTAFVASSRTARVAGELAGIADTGQVAMQLIGNAIRQSGYGEIVGSETAIGGAQAAVQRSQTLFADGASLVGCNGARFVDDTERNPVCGPAVDPNFDSLMVRFQGDAVIPPAQGRIDDCLGILPPAEALPVGHVGTSVVANRPMVQNVYYGAAGSLWCRGNGRAAEALPFPAPQQLVGNVEQFQVFYGFDDVRYSSPAANPGATVRSLRDAAFLNALPAETLPWDFVVSAHVCIVVRSAPDAARDLSNSTSYRYARCPMNAAEAAGAPPEETATDRALRRTYTQVFTVRSRATANPRQFLPD
ncbi:MAG: PilW family protein [Burkholderiales bacterium]